MDRGQIRFATPDSGPGLTIVDPIERKRVDFDTGRPVSPIETSTEQFVAPVDRAVSVTVPLIRYSSELVVYVRESGGELLATVTGDRGRTFPEGSYVLDLTVPMKVYLRIEGSFAIDIDADRTRFDLGDADRVAIGARSLHSRPAGTIRTTASEADLRVAISQLSSSLKTTSPERSFPSLRGHPPLVELGDSLAVPEGMTRPETGIRIEIPAGLKPLFEAAPLAFYLGAALGSGDSARLVTDDGWEHPLGVDRPFPDDIERILKQVFLLDCLTRTEGIYPVELQERTELEPVLEFDFAGLYDLPIAERLKRYIEVPFEVIEPQVPRWKSTVHLTPEPEQVEAIPFAVADLALIDVESPTGEQPIRPPAATVDADEDALYRALSDFGGSEPLVDVQPTDSWEDVWFGPGIPVHGTKGVPRAHRNRLERSPSSGPISVVIVQNEPEMGAEADIDAVYGTQTDLPFEITRHRHLRCDGLRDVLQGQHDFIHFIGHVVEDGLQCADGHLDTRSLETVGVDAFLLNACRSYEQGRGLIEAGATGGVVTIHDVVNAEAVTMGRTLAELLNMGFHLAAALEVASEVSVIGDLYMVLGDSGVRFAQKMGQGNDFLVLSSRDGAFDVEIHTFPTSKMALGSLSQPILSDGNLHSLTSGTIDVGQYSLSEARETFPYENLPHVVDGELFWDSDIDLEEFL